MESPSTCTQCGAPMRADDRFCPTCGASRRGATSVTAGPAGTWQSILDRLSAATAPRYRVMRLLGYGGMAGVYLAEEPRLGRRVAIKVMSPALMIDPGLVNRFEQEARTTAQLHHPNIVTIYDVDERDGLHYFVMAYVPGRTLAQVMTRADGPLPVRAVMQWLSHVGGALDYAHRAGVVHRDVKPGNILFDEDSNARVTDFGIAKVADEPSLTKTGMLVGTPAYMSPEQCTSGDVAGASDQYSLGIVAYEMLAGRPPFTGQTVAVLHAHVHESPPPLLELRPDCPPALAAVVERMLAKQPDARFPTIADAVFAVGSPPLRHDDPERTRMISMVAPDEGFTPVSTRPVSPAPGTRTPPAQAPSKPARTPPQAAPTPPSEETPSPDAPAPAQPTPVGSGETRPAGGAAGDITPAAATPSESTLPAASTTPVSAISTVDASKASAGRRRPLVYAAAAIVLVAAVAAGAVALRDGTGTSATRNDSGAPVAGESPLSVDGTTQVGGVSPAGGVGGDDATAGDPLDATSQAVRSDSGGARVATGSDAPASGDGARSDPAGPPQQTERPPVAVDPAADTPPRLGTLRVAGTLPAGTQIYVSGARQPRRRMDARTVELPPGSYRIEAVADGYQLVQSALDVIAGETVSWSPTLVAVPPPTPPPDNPPRDPPSSAYDQAEATQQIQQAIRAFVAAWETRSIDRVVAAYPGATADWRRTWAPFVENTSDVKDLTTSVQNLGAPSFDGETARISFVLSASYRDIRNQTQQPQFRFDARLRRTPDGWQLQELLQNR